jgi:WD40 repeat protein
VQAVAFSQDGKQLASASNDGTVLLWKAHAGTPPALLHRQGTPLSAVAYSADGTRVAAGGGDKVIWLLDPVRRREVIRLQGHTGRIKSLSFGARDRVLVSSSIDGTVGIWDVSAGPQQ